MKSKISFLTIVGWAVTTLFRRLSKVLSKHRSPLKWAVILCVIAYAGCAKPSATIPQAPLTRQDVAKKGLVAAANIYSGLIFTSDLIEQMNKGTPQILDDAQSLKAYKALRAAGRHTSDFKAAAIRFGTIESEKVPDLKAYIDAALKELLTLESLKFKDESKRAQFLEIVRQAQKGYAVYLEILRTFKSPLTADDLGVDQLKRLEGALPNA